MILCRSLNALRASRIGPLPLALRTYRSASPCRPFAASAVRQPCTGRNPSVRSKTHFGIKKVREGEVFVIERNGRFSKTLIAGVHFLIPFVDEIAFVHSLGETIVKIPRQHNVTNDGITKVTDCTLMVKIFDAKLASYWSKDPFENITELACATLHDVIKQLTSKMYEEQTNLGDNMMIIINDKMKNGGFKCVFFHMNTRRMNFPLGVRTSLRSSAGTEEKHSAEADVLANNADMLTSKLQNQGVTASSKALRTYDPDPKAPSARPKQEVKSPDIKKIDSGKDQQ